MFETIVVNVVANLLAMAIVAILGFLIVLLLPLGARLWLRWWAWVYPGSGPGLDEQYRDEMAVNRQVVRVIRALSFMVNVPRIARAQHWAERGPNRTTAPPGTAAGAEKDLYQVSLEAFVPIHGELDVRVIRAGSREQRLREAFLEAFRNDDAEGIAQLLELMRPRSMKAGADETTPA